MHLSRKHFIYNLVGIFIFKVLLALTKVSSHAGFDDVMRQTKGLWNKLLFQICLAGWLGCLGGKFKGKSQQN